MGIPMKLRTKLARSWSGFRKANPELLWVLLAILGGACGFIMVAWAVRKGVTQKFDEGLLLDMSEISGPVWLEEMGRDLTALGGFAALCLLIVIVCGYLLICRKYRALALVLAATLGGLVLNGLLKERFDRPRPKVVPYKSQVWTSSFPSGHSLNSAVIYLTLGSLLASLVERRRLKVYFLSVGLLLTILVGVSRVYMGVHYPTDVLAGWCAGLSWALLCSLVGRWLEQRGAVERVDE
jgi:undecaprenyl-diphosphatase